MTRFGNKHSIMHLARTYWGIPSESWEIGGQYHPDPRRPQADGGRWYWPPISKDEDGIPQYVRARCMAFTLLLSKLKPHSQDLDGITRYLLARLTVFLQCEPELCLTSDFKTTFLHFTTPSVSVQAVVCDSTRMYLQVIIDYIATRMCMKVFQIKCSILVFS